MSSITKSEARRWAKTQRSSICRGKQSAFREILLEELLPWLFSQRVLQRNDGKNDWVAVYSATAQEPDVSPVCHALHQQEIVLGLPRMELASEMAPLAQLYWHRYRPASTNKDESGTVLVQHPWGVWEPHPQEPLLDTPPTVVLLPCLAMDRRGNRLGYGQGFYDRALKHWKTQAKQAPLLISLCWQACILPESLLLQTEAWDIPVDYTLCESGWIPHHPLEADETR